MSQQEIVELLERYGLEWILDDNGLLPEEALDILDELGFIDLCKYSDND